MPSTKRSGGKTRGRWGRRRKSHPLFSPALSPGKPSSHKFCVIPALVKDSHHHDALALEPIQSKVIAKEGLAISHAREPWLLRDGTHGQKRHPGSALEPLACRDFHLQMFYFIPVPNWVIRTRSPAREPPGRPSEKRQGRYGRLRSWGQNYGPSGLAPHAHTAHIGTAFTCSLIE